MDYHGLGDLLECAICLERLDERSRVLPCQHTFCIKCLGDIIEKKGHLQCPECRTDFFQLSINNLPRNVLLVRILESLKNNTNKAQKIVISANEKNENLSSNDNNRQLNRRENIRPKEAASKRLSTKDKYEALLNQPCARALYNFASNEEGDLSFKKGAIITLAHEIDDNWVEGCLGNKRGSIPKNFIEILVPLPKIDDENVKHPFAKALYSYESKEEPEVISFREGDLIGMIKKVDGKWFEGILGGQYGFVPVNFVQLNKAGKELMSGDTSGSSSSSDEESEVSRKRQGRRSPRNKNSTREDESISNGSDALSKRHTIHVENPNEQQRQSRRTLNIGDEQPQERARAQSYGRRPLESAEPRTLANTVLVSRALRTSDDQMSCRTFSTTSASVSLTTSIPEYRTSESLYRTLSTSPSNSVEANIGGSGELYTALYTYSPARDDELALIQGDQYTVIEKHLDGWFKGFHMRSQQSGVFPGNYVKPSSQVTQQMLRTRPVIGYGSNPSSPNVPLGVGINQFAFPPRRNSPDSEEPGCSSGSIRANGENGSPGRKSGFMKLLKKNKNKRQTPPTPQPPQTTNSQSSLAPPSYYHSSMPGPTHHLVSRPSPMVPAEPPPPYTPSPTPFTTAPIAHIPSTTIETTTSSIISTVAGERFRAVATYPAMHVRELELRVGDVIYVTKKHTDGWYTGKSARTGSTGVFPSTFVEPHQ